MKLAIVGMGYLGTQLARELFKYDKDVIITHHSMPRIEMSVPFDFFTGNISDILAREIEVVFFPAKVEFTTNSEKLKQAMERFVQGCARRRIIYFSSDGIFDGFRGMYKEEDAPSSAQLYGKNLAICERIIQEMADDYCIIRPSYIYGSLAGRSKLDGRLAEAAKIIKKGEEYQRYSNMYRSPLHVRQVARISSELGLSNYCGIVHVAGPRVSVFEFIRQGLIALGLPTHNLSGVLMSKKDEDRLLPDTSLDWSRMTHLTNIEPMSVKESFRAYNGFLP